MEHFSFHRFLSFFLSGFHDLIQQTEEEEEEEEEVFVGRGRQSPGTGSRWREGGLSLSVSLGVSRCLLEVDPIGWVMCPPDHLLGSVCPPKSRPAGRQRVAVLFKRNPRLWNLLWHYDIAGLPLSCYFYFIFYSSAFCLRSFLFSSLPSIFFTDFPSSLAEFQMWMNIGPRAKDRRLFFFFKGLLPPRFVSVFAVPVDFCGCSLDWNGSDQVCMVSTVVSPSF